MAPSALAARTERGQRTRASLVGAAKRVFERDGFLNARISEIAKTAKVAHGTFYTYFTSKEEIFREVIVGVQADLLAMPSKPNPTGRPDGRKSPEEPVAGIAAANRAYVDAYRRNARLMGLLEQVATFNDDLRRMRLDMRRAFITRSGQAIARWQVEGLADPEIDPWYAANALCNMVDRFVYTWLVLGEEFETEKTIATLTRLWAQSLDLQPASGKTRSASSSGRHSRTDPVSDSVDRQPDVKRSSAASRGSVAARRPGSRQTSQHPSSVVRGEGSCP